MARNEGDVLLNRLFKQGHRGHVFGQGDPDKHTAFGFGALNIFGKVITDGGDHGVTSNAVGFADVCDMCVEVIVEQELVDNALAKLVGV